MRRRGDFGRAVYIAGDIMDEDGGIDVLAGHEEVDGLDLVVGTVRVVVVVPLRPLGGFGRLLGHGEVGCGGHWQAVVVREKPLAARFRGALDLGRNTGSRQRDGQSNEHAFRNEAVARLPKTG
jgi:hypothetical protein